MRKNAERHPLGFLMLGLYSLFTLFSMALLVYNSLRNKGDFLRNTLGVPKGLSFQNYQKLFVEENFLQYLGNSILILVVALVLLLMVASMVAYGIGRYHFKGKSLMLLYFLLGLMFPVQLGVVPVFLIIKGMGLFNSHWGVILVLSAGMSMPVLLLSIFFQGLPLSVYEAGKIDGASEWCIFCRIMLPMATPVLFSAGIIASVSIWNQFFIPLIFLQKEDVKTFPLAIMKYSRNMLYSVDLALASSVVATIPIQIAFFFFSKRILSGVAIGAVKE